VRIEPGNGDARPFDPEAKAGLMSQADHPKFRLDGDQPADIGPSDLDGGAQDAQSLLDE
jgi:hypothetical protein